MNICSEKRGLIAGICFGAAAVCLLMALLGPARVWSLWCIPQQTPHFADLRIVAGGAESAAQGFDPLVQNPKDPWERPLNYPRIWTELQHVGFDQSHVTITGVALVVLFILGLIIAVPKSDALGTAMVLAAVFSPAVMLGMERGNIDLLMFFMIAVSLALFRKNETASFIGIMLAFVMKIFPVFVMGVFLGSKNLRRWFITSLVVGGVYVALIACDLPLISAATLMGDTLSYGMNVLWNKAMSVNASVGTLVKYGSYLMVLLVGVFAISASRSEFTEEPSTSLDAFRVGAAVYVGTFLLGNNWDYRLMFLIPAIPQLRYWSASSVVFVRRISKLMLLALAMSLWHLTLDALLDLIPGGNYLGFALDEMANWTLFGGLAWLLARGVFPVAPSDT